MRGAACFGVLVLLGGLACSRYSKQEEQAPAPPASPSPPRAATLRLSGAEVDGDTDGGGGAPSGVAYAEAMLLLSQVQARVGKALALPAALLDQAATATSQLVAAGVRVWSYRADVDGRSYTVNLRGTAQGDSSDLTTWSMAVTTRPLDAFGCCEAFELATGAAASPGMGSWQVRDPRRPGSPAALLSVSYEQTSPTQSKLVVEVEESATSDGRLGRGSRLEQELAGDTVGLRVRDAAEAGPRELQWSRATGRGFYVDPDGRRACWGEAREQYPDISCPTAAPANE